MKLLDDKLLSHDKILGDLTTTYRKLKQESGNLGAYFGLFDSSRKNTS